MHFITAKALILFVFTLLVFISVSLFCAIPLSIWLQERVSSHSVSCWIVAFLCVEVRICFISLV